MVGGPGLITGKSMGVVHQLVKAFETLENYLLPRWTSIYWQGGARSTFFWCFALQSFFFFWGPQSSTPWLWSKNTRGWGWGVGSDNPSTNFRPRTKSFGSKKKKNNLKNVFLFLERTVNAVNDIHKIMAEKELFEKILLLQTTADKQRQTRDITAHVSKMNVCVRTLTITLGADRPVSWAASWYCRHDLHIPFPV